MEAEDITKNRSAANLNTTDLLTDEDLIHSSTNNNNNNKRLARYKLAK
jgi:hypothetical protein